MMIYQYLRSIQSKIIRRSSKFLVTSLHDKAIILLQPRTYDSLQRCKGVFTIAPSDSDSIPRAPGVFSSPLPFSSKAYDYFEEVLAKKYADSVFDIGILLNYCANYENM